LSLGTYPTVTLADARAKTNAARIQLDNSIDPSQDRQSKKQAIKQTVENDQRIKQGLPVLNSFEYVAMEWYNTKALSTSTQNQKNITGLLKRLFPAIGNHAITAINAPMLLSALKDIEQSSPTQARKTLQIAGQVFRYGIQTSYCERDISSDLKGALITAKGGHFTAITEPQRLGQLLRAIDVYSGSFVVKSALQLAPLLFVRPNELCQAEWQHIDLEAKEWRYVVSKTDTPHIVPLSSQAVEILSRVKHLTGNSRFVFTSEYTDKEQPISKESLLAGLRRLGFSKDDATIHGFRATARTLLEEVLKFPYQFIEQQLAHSVRDTNGRAYNRTIHLTERAGMMQVWSDYLDSLKNGAVIIPFNRTA
jgi:integrase